MKSEQNDFIQSINERIPLPDIVFLTDVFILLEKIDYCRKKSIST